MPVFHPSPAQRHLLAWAQAHPACPTFDKLCRNSGTPRSSYYYWSRNPAFRAWFASAWSNHLLLDAVPALNRARHDAPHRFRSWKPLFDLTFGPDALGAIPHWQPDIAATTVSRPPQRNQPLTAQLWTKNRLSLLPPPYRPSPACAATSRRCKNPSAPYARHQPHPRAAPAAPAPVVNWEQSA